MKLGFSEVSGFICRHRYVEETLPGKAFAGVLVCMHSSGIACNYQKGAPYHLALEKPGRREMRLSRTSWEGLTIQCKQPKTPSPALVLL